MSLGSASSPNHIIDLKNLRELGTIVKFPSGVDVCTTGDGAQTVFLIEEGLVVLTVTGNDGKQHYLAYRSPGWILSTADVILGCPHSATITTKAVTKLRLISAQRFLNELKQNDRLAHYVHYLHAREIHEQQARIAGLALLNVRQRLEEFLWEFLSALPEKKRRVQLPFTGAELTNFVASSPQYLSAVFNELEIDGIVKRSRGWLIIEDRSRLWHREK